MRMVFNPEQHKIDPETGLMIDKESGHPVGLVPKPASKAAFQEWPKWVAVHESHVVRRDSGAGAPIAISVPAFLHHHVDRVTGEVTVLVQDEDEERLASSEKETARGVSGDIQDTPPTAKHDAA
jgi:hypothetical protein